MRNVGSTNSGSSGFRDEIMKLLREKDENMRSLNMLAARMLEKEGRDDYQQNRGIMLGKLHYHLSRMIEGRQVVVTKKANATIYSLATNKAKK